MPHSATITAKIGPAVTVTAQAFSNVKEANWHLDRGILELKYDNGNGEKIVELDIVAATTVAHTITSTVHSITVT